MRLTRDLPCRFSARPRYAVAAVLSCAIAAFADPPDAQAQADVDRLADRVWLVEAAATIPAGTRYVFLGDNRVVISVPDSPPTTGTWAEDAEGLVVTHGTITSRLRILELTSERLRLRVTTRGTESEVALVAAVRPPLPPRPVAATAGPTPAAPASPPIPVGSPYRCGADAFRVSFEADKAYLTWPDGTSVVLSEVKVVDAPASRRTYTDGQVRVVEDTSEAFTRVLFARPGFRPRPCAPAR